MCQLLIKHMKQLASKLCSKSLQLCYFRFFLWWVQANAQCISQGGHEDHSQKAFPNKTFVVGWEKLSAESFFFQKSATSQPHLSQEMMDFAYGSYSPLHLVCSKAEFSLPPQAAALSTPRTALVHQEEANHSWLTLYISQHQLSTITHCFQACQGFQSCRLQHTYALAAG